MKKLLLSTAALTVILSAPGAARAGSIDYLTNQSAEYIRVLAYNHATSGADVVNYNPAGTAWLKDGLHLNFNWQFIYKDYSVSYEGEKFSSTKPTPFLPSFFAVYKWRDLAAFAAFTVPAGGGTLRYDDGVPFLNPLAALVDGATSATPTNGFFEGSSMYLAGSFGAAYRFFDMVSVSAVGRVVSAKKTYNGYATYGDTTAALDAEKTAFGIGGIFGVHVRPIKQLDIGIRYETETALEFETSSRLTNIKPAEELKGGTLESYVDGAKEQRNLPALLGVGIGVHPFEKLTISAALNVFFIPAADNDPDGEKPLPWTISYSDDYSTGLEFAFGAEYRFNKMWRASLGYNRTIPGGGADTYTDFEYALPSNTIGFGGRVTLFDRLNLTLATAMVFYDTSDNSGLHPIFPQPETYEKFAMVITAGAEYRLF